MTILQCVICLLTQSYGPAITVLDGNALCEHHLSVAKDDGQYGVDVRRIIARTPPGRALR